MKFLKEIIILMCFVTIVIANPVGGYNSPLRKIKDLFGIKQ